MTPPIPEFLSRLGYALLEHREAGHFFLVSAAPRWLAEIWNLPDKHKGPIPVAEKSPFLEPFLYEADAFLNADPTATCQSEPWIERLPSGKEIPLQAIALQAEGKRYLALQNAEKQFHERSQLLQTARSSHLEHERLLREIQKKEILLHCIVHDLSQPLSVMTVSLDCLAADGVSERAKGFLALGKNAGEQQLSMIRDILQVFSSDLKAAQEAEKDANFCTSLLHSANQVIASFVPVFEAQKVRVVLDDQVNPEANWLVRGEASRLQRIFSNILENALRYSPAGTTVTIRLEPDGLFLKACVDDEGPGLPPDLPPSRFFALFAKGKEGGGKAGLGLYFCRLTVERWGGAIGCESLSQRGTRFWFRLPSAGTRSAASSGPGIAADAAGESLPPVQPKRVLLADDQKDIRTLTTLQLERAGHQVVAVANGEKVLEALQAQSFDVILLDEQMPVMNGPEALRHIRERLSGPARPTLIALTGFNTDQDRKRLLDAGFDAVLGKPFRMQALEALLRGVPQSSVSAPPAGQSPGLAETAMDELLARVGGNDKLLQSIIRTFLRTTPSRLRDIRYAIQRKRPDQLAFAAHALKGSTSIFGAETARRLCADLQDMGRAGELQNAASVFEQLKEEIAQVQANLRGYAGTKSLGRAKAPQTKTPRSPRSNRKAS